MRKRSGYYIKVWNLMQWKKKKQNSFFEMRKMFIYFFTTMWTTQKENDENNCFTWYSLIKENSHFYVRINKFIHYSSLCFILLPMSRLPGWVVPSAIPPLHEHKHSCAILWCKMEGRLHRCLSTFSGAFIQCTFLG